LEQLLPLLDYTPNFYAYAQDREIDFILQCEEKIIPIEAKSGENINAVSFKRYIEKYKPEISVRFSTKEYLKNGAITNIPLYFVGKMFELTSIDIEMLMDQADQAADTSDIRYTHEEVFIL
jgi:hypothetical protein